MAGLLLAQDDNSRPIQVFGLGAAQDVAITAASVQSAAFSTTNRSRIIRVNADADCRIVIGVNPTAVATSSRLIAGTTEYFKCEIGDKIAVIRDGTDGILSVTEST